MSYITVNSSYITQVSGYIVKYEPYNFGKLKMPLNFSKKVFITCAITGSGGSQDRSEFVPRSPKQIADSAILAAKAGAAVVHCHVRDPNTGAPSRDKT